MIEFNFPLLSHISISTTYYLNEVYVHVHEPGLLVLLRAKFITRESGNRI